MPCFGGSLNVGVAEWPAVPASRRELARAVGLASGTLDHWAAHDEFLRWLDGETIHWLRYVLRRTVVSPKTSAVVLARVVEARRLFGLDAVRVIEVALLEVYDPHLIEAAVRPAPGS